MGSEIGIDAAESRINNRAKRIAHETGEDIKNIIERGKESTIFVKSMLSIGSVVTVEFDEQKRDKYHRLLGYVYLPDGKMLNDLIISKGYAQILTIPPNTKYTQIFLESLNEAMLSKKGLWK